MKGPEQDLMRLVLPEDGAFVPKPGEGVVRLFTADGQAVSGLLSVELNRSVGGVSIATLKLYVNVSVEPS